MFVLSLVKKHYRLQFYMVSGLKDSGLLMKLAHLQMGQKDKLTENVTPSFQHSPKHAD